MLKEKGEHVKLQEWKKLNALNRELTDKVHKDLEKAARFATGTETENDKKLPNTLTDPISAFVSMETEESYNNLAKMGEITLGDGQSAIDEAIEPTNIIWENFDMRPEDRHSRFLMIIGVIGFVLFLTFCVTFKAKDATK